MGIVHSLHRGRQRLEVTFSRRFGRLGIKLSFLSMALIAVLTVGTAVIVIDIMDGFFFRELTKRGAALAVSVATPASYSILAEDRLGLDHLVSKVEESQPDVLYVAITNPQGQLLAHSQLGAMGESFPAADGKILAQLKEVTVRSDQRGGIECFDFTAPIAFLDTRLGTVQLGIDKASLEQSKVLARRKIFFVAALVLLAGSIATLFVSRIVTQPVARLSEGVSRLKSGQYRDPIAAFTQDELGDLTRNFNAMAAELLAQKERLAAYADSLDTAYLDTVKILAAAIDARDPYTLGHSQRVAGLSLLLGRKLGLDPQSLRELEIACFLHDVGKIRVPDRILAKEGPLDPEETALMVRHVRHGADILGLAASLQRFIPTALSHHEHYDGRGYPVGMQGDEIPLFAAIVAIADAYDAMTSSRPYRAGRSATEAVAELRRCRGTQFSPHLVDLFVSALTEETGDLVYDVEGAA